MTSRRWLIGVVLAVLSVGVAVGQPVLEVTGTVQAKGGKSFAILKDVGVVQEGDVFEISTSQWQARGRVVSITAESVEVRWLDVTHTSEQAEESVADTEEEAVTKTDHTEEKAERQRPELRDPFWPVGYGGADE